MRIVGGAYRGRKIEISRGFTGRPTTDFAREALFNILSNHFDFEDIRVLDLFSGTGSISFEFASRGCREIDLVDHNRRSVQFIGKAAGLLGIAGIHAVNMDVFRFITVCKKQYHIVFADPPYDLKNLENIPDMVLNHQLLIGGGWFILEHSKTHQFDNHIRFHEKRRYGNVHFSFFRV